MGSKVLEIMLLHGCLLLQHCAIWRQESHMSYAGDMQPFQIIAVERAFNECQKQLQSQQSQHDNGVEYCPRIFDDWTCWNETPAGTVAYSPCPAFITGFDPKRLAHKVCEIDGTWFQHPLTNKTWSNYTTCVDLDDLKMHQLTNRVYVIGYSVSVAALLLSFFIFSYFRSLRCTRITIHKNLFISFIINNGMWIVWLTAVNDTPVFFANEISCQVMHVLLQYFLVCNYFWMFCEGLYLHTILVIAFVNEDNIMRSLYAIGWGIPAVLTAIYTAARGSIPEETIECWINDSPFTWILTGPVCLSMLANLIFLVNIVNVLVTKLRAVNTWDTNQTRKAVRATVILIPLLGLHYVITPFRSEEKTPAVRIYSIISAVVTSFQGLCVAMLFCLFNGEVLGILRKKWRRHNDSWLGRQSVAKTTISQPFDQKHTEKEWENISLQNMGDGDSPALSPRQSVKQ